LSRLFGWKNQLDELNKPERPDEPDRRFTRKRSRSAIAAETLMDNAG
jgi:hypothetical protein